MAERILPLLGTPTHRCLACAYALARACTQTHRWFFTTFDVAYTRADTTLTRAPPEGAPPPPRLRASEHPEDEDELPSVERTTPDEDGIPAWHPEDMADMGEGARELLGRRRCHHCGEYFWDDQSHYSRSAECEVANEALAGKGGPSPERESLSPSDSDEATNIEERKRQVQRWVSKMAGGRR